MATARQKARQRKFKLEDLRRQAIEASGQLAGIELEVGDKTFFVPHPLMLDDEGEERVAAYNRGDGLDKETLLDDDGEPIKDNAGNPVTRFKEPHQIDGVVLEPHVIRSAKAILGEEEYARFKEAGGHANDVQLAWNFMVTEARKTEEEDPSS